MALIEPEWQSADHRLYSLPYWNARPGDARLAGIYMLRHGDSHRRRRLCPADALRRLASQVLWPSLEESRLRAAFHTLSDIVARVPVWDLAFAPRADRRRWPDGGGRR